MAKYLLEGNFTLDGVKGVKAKGGSARLAAAKAAAESVGGTIEAYYFAFGGTDVYAIGDFPDNVSAAALSPNASPTRASGTAASSVTTVAPSMRRPGSTLRRDARADAGSWSSRARCACNR